MIRGRKFHAGSPRVNSIKKDKEKGDRMIGDYVLHPTKGWRKVTVYDMLAYKDGVDKLIKRALTKKRGSL